jgi:hypothetical protein
MKKLLSILLALTMLLALMPAALADGSTDAQTVSGGIASGWLAKMDEANWPWVAADLASAQSAGAFGSGQYALNDAQKQAYVDRAAAALAKTGVSNGDMAKYIIGLAALGYDARQLTTYFGEPVDAAGALSANAESEQSIYTLPWMLIALRQFGTAYEKQCLAIEKKIIALEYASGGWGYNYGGKDNFDTDATSFALLALGAYRGTDAAAKTAIDSALAALKTNAAVSDAGVVTGWGNPSAESTGLLISALAAVGSDPKNFNGKNLVNGLLTMTDKSGAGFTEGSTGGVNAIATEQGFRGLVSAAGYAKNGGAYSLYDFGGTLAPAKAAAAWVPFGDAAGSWAFGDIAYVYEKSLMDGVSAGTFQPAATATRAMIVTVLWRASGSPAASAGGKTFSDAGAGWYADAVKWAVEKGVVNGYADGTFRPQNPVTREQFAAMLWRLAGSPASTTELSSYTDASAVSSWAVSAMKWAGETGIVSGVTATELRPASSVNRAQTAAMLARSDRLV